jgi:dolichol-phosphate mannosyltransferase
MIYILLAACNEAENIGVLLRDIRTIKLPEACTIILVDDGSSDATGTRAQENTGTLSLELLVHQKNQGLGRALATGFAHIAPRITGDDIVITMDADATHPPQLIPALIAALRQGADLAIASRFTAGGGQTGLPLKRRICSRGAAFLLKIVWPLAGVHDYTCGYRAYRGALIQHLAAAWPPAIVEETGFAATLEVLLKSSILGAHSVEVPFFLDYAAKKGASKMRIVQTIAAELRLITRCLRDTSDKRRLLFHLYPRN